MEQRLKELREQIQEDIITYCDTFHIHNDRVTALCQIVVDNFRTLKEDKED